MMKFIFTVIPSNAEKTYGDCYGISAKREMTIKFILGFKLINAAL